MLHAFPWNALRTEYSRSQRSGSVQTLHCSFIRTECTWRTSGLLCPHALWYSQAGRVPMTVLGAVRFSAWRNTLQKTGPEAYCTSKLTESYESTHCFPHGSDFHSSFAIKLNTEMIIFHKDSREPHKTVLISETTSIYHTLTWVHVLWV